MVAQNTMWQWSVTDYGRMFETGILSDQDRVELIDGEVRAMSPIGPLHAAIVNRLNRLLTQLLPQSLIVSVQNPVQLSNYTQPQPDLAVLHERADFYAHAHPQSQDIVLLIEVADSSLAYDRNEKLPHYAQAAIPEIWIVDVSHSLVEQYTEPRGLRYHTMRVFDYDEVLTSTIVTLNGEQIFG